MQIHDLLVEYFDPGYKAFNSSLIPTLNPGTMMGVRMPDVRRVAKSISSDEAAAFMDCLPHAWHEENLVHGCLINAMRDFDECVQALNAFLPYVDNWAVCDLLAPACFKKLPAALPEHIERWMNSSHLYTVRFAIGTLMSFYLNDAFRTKQVDAVVRTANTWAGEYYLDMMAAWYFATALYKQWDATLPYIEQQQLAPWTHNKAIQKAIESRHISAEHKDYLRGFKIRG